MGIPVGYDSDGNRIDVKFSKETDRHNKNWADTFFLIVRNNDLGKMSFTCDGS